jgi:serine protease inhibitor
VEAGHADQAARAVLEILDDSPGIHAALGLWNRRELVVREEWLKTLPDGMGGELTGNPQVDQPVLNAWADEQTGGLIPGMPITVDDGTLLVLAGALGVRTTWLDPFVEGSKFIAAGPWSGQPIPALWRVNHAFDQVQVAGAVGERLTMCQVMGTAGIDVLLMLGEDGRSAAEVLTSGIDVLNRGLSRTPAHALPGTHPGPGISVGYADTFEPEDPRLRVMVPPFTIRSDHDLLKHPEVFGLAAVTDRSHGHFPAISDRPLAVSAAAQSCTASFQARGFEAAAVTAVAAVPGNAAPPRPTYRTKEVSVAFDRPFGFLNIHRGTGLILTAGWLAEPPALG